MRTSATGPSSNRHGMTAVLCADGTGPPPGTMALPRPGGGSAGFTLIELLVVLVIIGILITFATLAIGNDQESVVQEEARRIAALIELAGEEATLQGRELGLQLDRGGYRFVFLAPQAEGPPRWLALEQDRLLRPRRFHPAITPELELEGQPQPLPLEAPEEATPQLFIFSSGERTPFLLRLGADQGRVVREIEAGPVGALRRR